MRIPGARLSFKARGRAIALLSHYGNPEEDFLIVRGAETGYRFIEATSPTTGQKSIIVIEDFILEGECLDLLEELQVAVISETTFSAE